VKTSCGTEVEALTTSSTSGDATGHFTCFLTAADGAPTLGGAILLSVTDS
jgi:hypothetical protein